MKRTNKNFIMLIFISVLVVIATITITNLYKANNEAIYKKGYWEGVENQFTEERILDKKEIAIAKSSCYKLSKNEKINSLLEKHFNCDEAKIMYAIAGAESGRKAEMHNRGLNKNGSVDFGYFQINTIHKPLKMSEKEFELAMYNLATNFEYGEKVLRKQGFQAWSTFNNKKYLAYLK